MNDGRRAPGQNRKKYAALTDDATHSDSTALSLDKLFRQRQAQSGSLVAFAQARFELLELTEKLGDFFRRNANAGILDFDAEKSTDLPPKRGSISCLPHR